MSIKKCQVAMHSRTGFSRDDAINVLYFDKQAGVFTDEGLANAIAGCYSDISSKLNHGYNGMTIKIYEADQLGPPVFTKAYPQFGGLGTERPTEVALCLSYSADDNSAGTPKRRGRIYLPYSANFQRPDASDIAAVLDFGSELAQIGVGVNTTWVMHSASTDTYLKIESISCDDAWDTQRRRGLRATSRTRRDVQ